MVAMQGEPPAVSRQRVRRALRRFRNETELSQGDVARRLGWSLSKMQRIEGAEVAISVTDLRALLAVYGVDDGAEIERLTEDARISRRQRWWMPAEYREQLTDALQQLMQFEGAATAIRAYQPALIPGVLQTLAVAEIVLGWKGARLTDEQRRVRLEVRMQRRKHMIEREGAPPYYVILDESVIKRHIGGAKVMAEQLEFLAETAERPNVHVRVVPFSKGALIGVVDAFQVLSLGDADDVEDSVLYREKTYRDEWLDDASEVGFAVEMFETLWAEALTEAGTVRALTAEAAALRSSLDFG
jgi:transcriptional regulator with XRE-family HTH domain